MAKQSHYSPAISRPLVSVLYYEAQARQIPMTQLVDVLLRQALAESKSWEVVFESKIAEQPPPLVQHQ